jgi:hypothetical protein
MLRQTLEYGRNLRRSLALAKDDFGHADSQHTMMVNFGEAQVFKR